MISDVVSKSFGFVTESKKYSGFGSDFNLLPFRAQKELRAQIFVGDRSGRVCFRILDEGSRLSRIVD